MTRPAVSIRFARRDDLPAVAQLRRRVFQHSEQPDAGALARYLELVLFDSPWFDAELPSLVMEAAGGAIAGFMGRIVRPYRRQGQTLRGAVATEVMLDPAMRGQGLGSKLMSAFLAGGQDFTVADRANEAYRGLTEGLGGRVASWYSWYWSLPLRPSRVAMARLGWRGAVRLTSPLTGAFDALATRVVPGRFRRRVPQGAVEDLDPGVIPALLPECVSPDSVYPVYTDTSLQWVLARLADKLARTHSAVDRRAVCLEPDGIVGWFISALRPDGVAEVVQLAAKPQYRGLVLSHVAYRAWLGGASVVTGRLDPFLAAAVVRERIACTLAQPWVVIHARDAATADVFSRGNVFLSRLEGEWWLAT